MVGLVWVIDVVLAQDQRQHLNNGQTRTRGLGGTILRFCVLWPVPQSRFFASDSALTSRDMPD